MDTLTEYLIEARAAWRRGDWYASRAAYVRVDGVGSMPLDDMEAYASATLRLGSGREATRLAERVYDRLVRTDPAAAARKAVDVALEWRTRGHDVVAAAWADRARALVVRDTEVVGYLAYLDASAAVGDRAVLTESATTLRDNASHTGDAVVAVLGRVVAGLAALADARRSEGLSLLDAALVPVIDECVPREWAWDVYRTVLGTAAVLVDDDRLVAWRRSLRTWCDIQGVAPEFIAGSRT